MQFAQISLTLALAALLGAFPTTRKASLDEYYERALDSAIDRASAQLQKRNDFFEEHATWEEAFEVKSEHYRLRTVGSRSAANKLVAGLEFMLGQYQALLATDFVPAQRFDIDVVPLAEYNARGGSAAEHSSFYGSFLESNGRVAVSYTPNSEYLGILATHSACHQYIEQAFGRSLPLWIAEGLSAYFASFWNNEWSKSEFQRVSAGPLWIDMRNLLGGRPADYLNDGDTRLIELGMLFRFLLQHNEDSGENAESPFVNFLRASVRGQRSDTQNYSQLALQKYEQALRNFAF